MVFWCVVLSHEQQVEMRSDVWEFQSGVGMHNYNDNPITDYQTNRDYLGY